MKLVKVGKGKHTHAEDGGRALCEANVQYTTARGDADIIALPERGQPTCHWCLTVLARERDERR